MYFIDSNLFKIQINYLVIRNTEKNPTHNVASLNILKFLRQFYEHFNRSKSAFFFEREFSRLCILQKLINYSCIKRLSCATFSFMPQSSSSNYQTYRAVFSVNIKVTQKNIFRHRFSHQAKVNSNDSFRDNHRCPRQLTPCEGVLTSRAIVRFVKNSFGML